ncbi:ATP-binding protein [Kitasatospora sp. RB6PN24]|uniref:ATP-binding protein n=1 Tax=Kitasatospora humi TaxID=2893891 RepID=UPI001E44F13D|nr:ATP-binding protein [Kitasatospora humi]MCC9309419.1 ATP-binding protein [Kitasatospora humi]
MSDTASFPIPQEWDVGPDVAAVPAARRLVIDIARFWRVPLSDDALSDVELCAGELLANAMEHTKARCRVTVRWTGLRLRVEVADSSPYPPDPAIAEDTVMGGRGLMVVAGLAHSWGWGLAHSWGWEPSEVGKVVWFEYAADQLPGSDDRLTVRMTGTSFEFASRLGASAPRAPARSRSNSSTTSTTWRSPRSARATPVTTTRTDPE